MITKINENLAIEIDGILSVQTRSVEINGMLIERARITYKSGQKIICESNLAEILFAIRRDLSSEDE